MRVYTVPFDNVAITAVQDLFEIIPADDKPTKMLGLELSQSTETGDTAEEMLRVSVRRFTATVTGGSGGSAPTPRLIDGTGSAAGFAAEVNNTTQATTSGTNELLQVISWNVRTGYQLWLPPECWYAFVHGQALIVRLDAAPADSVSTSGTLWLGEEG